MELHGRDSMAGRELLHGCAMQFRTIHGMDPEIMVRVPGRVNLLGDHTDYNDGYVLPAAIDRSIFIGAGRRPDEMLHLDAPDVRSSAVRNLGALAFDPENLWSNYPAGAAKMLQRKGLKIQGANLCIHGNIPIGAGLSSSAAVCVASTIALSILSGLHLSNRDIVLNALETETDFIGVQCGVMDQYIAMEGRRDHALFLDCRSYHREHVPFPAHARITICDLGLRRSLSDTAYNLRGEECREAVRLLAKFYPGIGSLRDVTLEQFEAVAASLPSVYRKRVLHVLSENIRVLEGVKALYRNDLGSFGRLMTESHRSLCDNYEVSTKEMDAFVHIAMDVDGVYGARMTGAGFGGSGICLVKEDAIDELIFRIRAGFRRQAGGSIAIYTSSIEDGAEAFDPRRDMSRISFASR